MIGLIYQIIFCIYILLNAIIKGKYDKYFTLTIIIAMSFILLYDLSFLIFFLIKLFCLHNCLCIQNLTFYEYHKKKILFGFNPFNNYFCYNFKDIFCKKERKTYIFDNSSEINKKKLRNSKINIFNNVELTQNSLNEDNSNIKN